MIRYLDIVSETYSGPSEASFFSFTVFETSEFFHVCDINFLKIIYDFKKFSLNSFNSHFLLDESPQRLQSSHQWVFSWNMIIWNYTRVRDFL